MIVKALSAVSVMALLVGGTVLLNARNQQDSGTSTHRTPQTLAEFEELFAEVSNWGRWGDDDELGTLNLITDAKRREAAALVEYGISVSLSHDLITEQGPDMPNPFEMGRGGSLFTYGFHSTTHTHFDALCQFDYKGELYNGFKASEVKGPDGCAVQGVEKLKDGIVTRGILLDIPRLKGLPYLEPGTPVYVEDIEAWEELAGVKVGPGDAIFLRTGRWQRRAELGPWQLYPAPPGEGEAGYHVSTVPWMKERDVTFVGADVSNDVTPAGVGQEVLAEVRLMPVHSLAIVALGIYIVDAMDLEAVAETAARLNKWEFMVTGAPIRAAGGTGALLNLTATF